MSSLSGCLDLWENEERLTIFLRILSSRTCSFLVKHLKISPFGLWRGIMHSVVHAQDVSYMISPENVFGPADPGVLLTDWPDWWIWGIRLEILPAWTWRTAPPTSWCLVTRTGGKSRLVRKPPSPQKTLTLWVVDYLSWTSVQGQSALEPVLCGPTTKSLTQPTSAAWDGLKTKESSSARCVAGWTTTEKKVLACPWNETPVVILSAFFTS